MRYWWLFSSSLVSFLLIHYYPPSISIWEILNLVMFWSKNQQFPFCSLLMYSVCQYVALRMKRCVYLRVHKSPFPIPFSVPQTCLCWVFLGSCVHFLKWPEAVWGTGTKVSDCFTASYTKSCPESCAETLVTNDWNTTSAITWPTGSLRQTCVVGLLLSGGNHLKLVDREEYTSDSHTALVRITKARVVSICSHDKTALISCTHCTQTFVSPWSLHHLILGKLQQLTIH